MQIKDILKNPNDLLIAVDFDGTLCEGDNWITKDLKPKYKMIEYVNSLYRNGAHIIIYTARAPRDFVMTYAWLVTHQVQFHGIAMQHKPGADIYIDDKAINISDLTYEET